MTSMRPGAGQVGCIPPVGTTLPCRLASSCQVHATSITHVHYRIAHASRSLASDVVSVEVYLPTIFADPSNRTVALSMFRDHVLPTPHSTAPLPGQLHSTSTVHLHPILHIVPHGCAYSCPPRYFALERLPSLGAGARRESARTCEHTFN
jgi:hypothetical protein